MSNFSYRTGVRVGILIIATIAYLVFAYFLEGPILKIVSQNNTVQISNIFLDDYDLGFSHVQIQDLATSAILCDYIGIINDVNLRAGMTPAEKTGHFLMVKSHQKESSNGQSKITI
jgi:hypothetical protein